MTSRHLTAAFVALLALSPAARAEVSQETLDAISIPDKVETAIGTLEFFDGVPTDATVATVYDNLDRMRGVQVYLDHQGAASLYAMRMGNAGIGANTSSKVTITEQLLQWLASRADTIILHRYCSLIATQTNQQPHS